MPPVTRKGKGKAVAPPSPPPTTSYIPPTPAHTTSSSSSSSSTSATPPSILAKVVHYLGSPSSSRHPHASGSAQKRALGEGEEDNHRPLSRKTRRVDEAADDDGNSEDEGPVDDEMGSASALPLLPCDDDGMALSLGSDLSEDSRSAEVKVEPTDEDSPPPKKGRKPIKAKAAVWKDIPDWGDRTDCPLLSLPTELLDLCFGTSLNHGLTVRDYLALAGASRYFRHHLDDEVFHGVYTPKSEARYSNYNPASSTFASRHIFSRVIPDWRVEPLPVPLHKLSSVLRIPRSTWTKAEYDYHKAYKKHYADRQRRHRRLEALIDARKAAARRARFLAGTAYESVFFKGMNRTVRGRVKGLADGESAIPKIAQKSTSAVRLGAVEVPASKDSAATSTPSTSSNTASSSSNTASSSSNTASSSSNQVKAPSSTSAKSFVQPLPYKRQSATFQYRFNTPALEELEKRARESRKYKRGGKDKRQKTWTVPDTDSEDDVDDVVPVKWHWKTGKRLPFDHYPSQWRQNALQWMSRDRVNKKTAMSEFKVSEAQLLCIKHCLIANPMNTKAYLRAAVEALALRCHGGPLGHVKHLRTAEEKRLKAHTSRQKKKLEAKANGTYVKKTRRHYGGPQNSFWWEEVYHRFWDQQDDSDYEDCDCFYCDMFRWDDDNFPPST
ncbi:hypothetical protein IAT38_007377 [Cryptococcus sp. DSM 104549]